MFRAQMLHTPMRIGKAFEQTTKIAHEVLPLQFSSENFLFQLYELIYDTHVPQPHKHWPTGKIQISLGSFFRSCGPIATTRPEQL